MDRRVYIPTISSYPGYISVLIIYGERKYNRKWPNKEAYNPQIHDNTANSHLRTQLS
jgi:hypothetical protein